MADVFSQLHIQIVFAVKNRQALIQPEWEGRLQRYITGIVTRRGHKLLAIGGMSDHIHIFMGLRPADSISELVREIKVSSNKYIKINRLTSSNFAWQGGYGVFSYSYSHIDRVCKYVLNQKEHHRKKTFEDEFRKILKDQEIEMGKKQIFDFFTMD